jgi:hypothetical protein
MGVSAGGEPAAMTKVNRRRGIAKGNCELAMNFVIARVRTGGLRRMRRTSSNGRRLCRRTGL